MSRILYTICSCSHLPQAKIMIDSFWQYNPGVRVVIGLADKISNRVELADFNGVELVEAAALQIKDFDIMCKQYTVLELACALKSYFGVYIMEQYKPELLLYADTDIYFFNSIDAAVIAMGSNAILITPHYCTAPPNDNKQPAETDILRSGLYNAGFYVLKNHPSCMDFLYWWRERMFDKCFYNFAEGMAVDQNWLNAVPLYFNDVYVCCNAGLNVAYWNLHEREISENSGRYFVNKDHPLVFFHISGYNIHNPELFSKHQNRYKLTDYEIIVKIFLQYKQLRELAKWEKYNGIPCAYGLAFRKASKIGKMVNYILSKFGYQLVKQA